MHKYYVSITEAAFNGKTGSIEVSIKFIGHDLEKALTEAGAPNLFLGTEKENEQADKYIKDYISQRLVFTVNQKDLEWKLIGKEVNDDDFIYCYLESTKTGLVKEITIKNTLLTEVFPAQKNAVYLTINGMQETFNFRKGSESETYNLN